MSTVVLDRPVVRSTATSESAATLPRVLTSLMVGALVCASLAPSLLPRAALTQAVVTAVFAALGLAVSTLLHRTGAPLARMARIHPTRAGRRVAITAAIGGVITSWAFAAEWQNTLRSAMGVDSVGLGHWMEVASVASALFLLLYLVGAALTALTVRLGAARSTMLALCVVIGIQFAVGPALWHTMADRFGTSNSAIDPDLAPPTSPLRAGSVASMVSWDSLGREGRKFVSANDAARSVRTYVGLDSAPTLSARTTLAVDEMERAGAFDRSAVVVAIPTGSGWIDEHAATGIEAKFGGDVAITGLQYSYRPSWATFLFAQTEAREAATALLGAVASHIDALPPRSRPALFAYGQSLGSVGGSTAYETVGSSVCGALWAGPPAGAVDTSGAVVLANSSDPVVRWSTDLLFGPPDLHLTRPDAPSPHWIPVVGFLQTSIDMVSALGAPPGHGHRYGDDQGTDLPDCDQ